MQAYPQEQCCGIQWSCCNEDYTFSEWSKKEEVGRCGRGELSLPEGIGRTATLATAGGGAGKPDATGAGDITTAFREAGAGRKSDSSGGKPKALSWLSIFLKIDESEVSLYCDTADEDLRSIVISGWSRLWLPNATKPSLKGTRVAMPFLRLGPKLLAEVVAEPLPLLVPN